MPAQSERLAIGIDHHRHGIPTDVTLDPPLDLAISRVLWFVLRWDGRHVFNPSAFGIVAALLFADDAWVSTGQWGSAPILALWVAGVGSLVIRRAERTDVTWAFLAAYVGGLLGRAVWLGDPIAIPLHALGSGALLVFAFFMISDPATTPASRAGRVLFAALVAVGAGLVQFGFYRANGPIYALVALAFLVPWIDRLLPAISPTTESTKDSDEKGTSDATLAPPRPVHPPRPVAWPL